MITVSTASFESNRTVGVLGSSVHTGRFVVTELLRRGFTPIAIGRNEANLAASGFSNGRVETRIATLEDPVSLDQALTVVAAVINCSRPCLATGAPLAIVTFWFADH